MLPFRFSTLRWALAGLLVAALTVPVGAAASTLLRLDLQGLVANSSDIVRGEVASIEYDEREARIWTEVEVRVGERWKGDGGGSVTIRLPGGRRGDMVTRVHGMPHFRADEEVLLFLTPRDGENAFLPTGLLQGAFQLEVREDGAEMAVPQVEGVRLLAPDGDTGEVDETQGDRRIDPTTLSEAEPAPVHRTPVPVDELKRRVLELTADGRSR